MNSTVNNTMNNSNESVDVLIIGADLAAMGGAWQLRGHCLHYSSIVLELRAGGG